MELGLLTVNGLYATDQSCVLGENCSSINVGVGLRDGDRLMLKSLSCSSGVPAEGLRDQSGVSSPAILSGKHFDFGVFTLLTSPHTFVKCWCQEEEAEPSCLDALDYQAESGTLTMFCPAGFFLHPAACASHARSDIFVSAKALQSKLVQWDEQLDAPALWPAQIVFARLASNCRHPQGVGRNFRSLALQRSPSASDEARKITMCVKK